MSLAAFQIFAQLSWVFAGVMSTGLNIAKGQTAYAVIFFLLTLVSFFAFVDLVITTAAGK